MKPRSQRHHRNYRIKTQEQKSLREHDGSPNIINPNSIVFQSQVKSLQNYFQFLQTTFGKKVEIKQMVKNVPHGQQIHEQFAKQTSKKRPKCQYMQEVCIKMKSSTTGALDGFGKVESYRNGCKHSLVQMPSSRLKIKFNDSQRKRHSYLMQRMNYVPRKVNTSPIHNQQFSNKDENLEFLPVGKSINKDDKKGNFLLRPRQKLSSQLLRGITYKRPKHELIVKYQSQIKRSCHFTEKNDETITEGPWRIIDTTQYNPRSYYSTYR